MNVIHYECTWLYESPYHNTFWKELFVKYFLCDLLSSVSRWHKELHICSWMVQNIHRSLFIYKVTGADDGHPVSSGKYNFSVFLSMAAVCVFV